MRTMEREHRREQERRRWQIAHELTAQFIERYDLYAIQLPDGRYASVKKRFTSGIMYLHLQGQLTVGAYLLDQQSQTRQTVLDVDDDQAFAKLMQLAADLDRQGIPAYLESSRRGGHLRLFYDPAIPGQKAKSFGQWLLSDYHLSAETYPKQAVLGDGPGSLVRLPFGVHRLTGQRYGFIHPDGSSLGTMYEQVKLLAHPKPVPQAFIEDHQYQPPARADRMRKQFSVSPESGNTPWEKIKTSISVYDFVRQYVELSPSGSGFLGQCPFHEDKHPSFGVNVEGNYWNCFAGCGGGSVIDFWMMYQEIDFKTAVGELEEMLFGGNHGRTITDSTGSR